MLGKVTTWYMSPEELADYVKKHPIKPSEKPFRSRFSDESIDYEETTARRKAAMKKLGMLTMTEEDKEKIHELYIAGETIQAIADELELTVGNVGNYISRMRQKQPKKWPYRREGKK